MTTTTKNLLSILFFIASMLFLVAATNITESDTTIPLSGCYHCGSVSACNDGGESYGYPACDILDTGDCAVQGFPNCVNMPEPPPGEEPIE